MTPFPTVQSASIPPVPRCRSSRAGLGAERRLATTKTQGRRPVSRHPTSNRRYGSNWGIDRRRDAQGTTSVGRRRSGSPAASSADIYSQSSNIWQAPKEQSDACRSPRGRPPGPRSENAPPGLTENVCPVSSSSTPPLPSSLAPIAGFNARLPGFYSASSGLPGFVGLIEGREGRPREV
jgi:hypothetical protein